MSVPGKLSLEQEFKLQMLEGQVKTLELDQAQGYILELLRQMMVKDNIVKDLLRAEL